jgi:xanthine dehydrogenase iron-sulfur cluster and FAD-binding subunit A
MKPVAFDYVRVQSLDDAIALLAQHGAEATVLAGGVSLGAMLNMRLVRPGILVDIKGIEALQGIRDAGNQLHIGAIARQAAVMANGLAMAAVPLLAKAFPHIGHMQTRSRGTVGGSIAHADPSAELPLCLVTLDGAMALQSQSGVRTVKARDFFTGVLSTVRRSDELLTAIHVPTRAPRSGFSFDEIAQRHGDFAIVAAACHIHLNERGLIHQLDVGLGGVEDRPLAFTLREFIGTKPGATTARAVADHVVGLVTPSGDVKASAAYRKALVRLLVERVFMQAAASVEHAAREAVVPKATRVTASKPTGAVIDGHAKAAIDLTVNGRAVRGNAEPRMLLSDFLRHDLGCYGVRVGCEHGVCGACTILVDGVAQRSCLQRAVEADGKTITTVEGLSPGNAMNALQEAFRRHHALQCGFCTPGILASATHFLRDNAQPTEAEVRDMLSGHICRCTGYHGIVQAILDAAGK